MDASPTRELSSNIRPRVAFFAPQTAESVSIAPPLPAPAGLRQSRKGNSREGNAEGNSVQSIFLKETRGKETSACPGGGQQVAENGGNERAVPISVHIDPCDLLFIDTRHTADQLTNEFHRHASKVRRWIVLHDTQIFGERGEDGGPGLLPAVRRFLNENPEWSVVHHTQTNHGLTVLSRDPRDKPVLPSTITMAANFTKSLAAHVADGLQKVEAPELRHRLEICTLCDQRNDDRCSVCGCYLAEKASWRSSECPLGKWNQKQEVGHVE